MANGKGNNQGNPDLTKLVISVISAFGLGSIFVVVIGRLWTISYFDYYGLSTGDLEFGIEDFAFRSLDVFISLGLAALGIVVAWQARKILKRAGNWFMAVEIFFVVLLAWLMLEGGLDRVVDQMPWLAGPGRLGVISGIVLILMIFLIADIWFGPQAPEQPEGPKPREGTEQAKGGENANGDQTQGFLSELRDHWYQVVAGIIAVGILTLYLPLTTDRLAEIQAKAILEQGRLPIAILETLEDPLPSAIASDADALRSNPVRVVLAESQNTYVLNSTQCKAIGELQVTEEDGGTIAANADYCRVFAIPTKRIKSIEYLFPAGIRPPNDSPALAEAVGLSEAFDDSVSTKDASDEKSIRCPTPTPEPQQKGEEDVALFNSVWYKVTPDTKGALFVSARGDSDLKLVVGIWEGSEEAELKAEPIAGSGSSGSACETVGRVVQSTPGPETEANTTVTVAATPSATPTGTMENAEPDSEKVVATMANLEPDKTYFIAIGSKEDRGGQVKVNVEFFSGSYFATGADVASEMLPTIEIQSVEGRVQLELQEFEEATYDLLPFNGSQSAPKFTLKLLDSKGSAYFVKANREDENGRTLFDARLSGRLLLEPGTWRLTGLGDFKGLATLRIITVQPDLVISFGDVPFSPVDEVLVQAALLLSIDTAEMGERLGLNEPVIVDPNTYDEGALTFLQPNEGEPLRASELLDRVAGAEDLNVEVVFDERVALLREAAETLEQQLVEQLGGTGIGVTVGNCEEPCIRITISFPVESLEAEGTPEPGLVSPPNQE
jgi:hypothetical protein